ncbi:peptidoglycan DD-metalloendopeptidase family protein [Evansella clarkii]|uniref:peptidoglycan DD-metalloendopeptidase family protein n=1 Tax=Evansella clarkii TaxID=79879 RepID=UPI000996A9C2|nr:peptidoglycan DD-metalloendopeptidase family protein [Evansella clarkii]
MTDRIKGLSIGLDLETTQVERGLTGLKDRLKTVNSEMRNNMSAFDRSDRSVEKYEKRLEGLNKKIEVQTKITDEAEKKYKEMVEQHGEGSKEAEKAAQEFNKQSAELNNLQNYTEGVRKELKKLNEEQRIANSPWTKTGKMLDETGKKMSKAGEGIQNFGKVWTGAVLGVGAAAAGLGVSLFALTNKVTENADAVAKGAARMGVSTDFYQEMDYWASQNGLSHQSMENALQRLNQRMGLAAEGNEKYADALTRLGVDMDGVRDGTISTEDAFATSIQTLSEMTDESEQAALAGELFGNKLGQELLPALRDGSMTIEEAKQKAEELGIVMSEDQIKAAEEFQDAQDSIKRAMGGVVNSIGLELMPHFQRMLDWVLANMPQIRAYFQNAIDGVTENVMKLINWWRELSDGARRWIGIAAAVAVAIGPMALAFGTFLKVAGPIVSLFGRLFMWVGRVGGILPALKVGFAALTGPIGIAVAVIGALTAGFVVAYRSSDTFRERVDIALAGAKKAFQAAIEYIKPVIDNVVQTFKDFASSITQFWRENEESITGAISNIMTGVMIFLSALWDAFKTFWPAVELIFKTAWDAIVLVFEVAKNTVMGIIQILAGLLTGDISKMMEGIKTVFSGGFKAIIDFALSFIRNIIDFFRDLYMNLVGNSIVPDMVNAIVDWFLNLGRRAREIVSEMVSRVIGFFVDLKDRAIQRTKELRDKVLNSIQNLRDNVQDRIKRMRDNTVERFTNLKDTFISIGTALRDRVTNLIQALRDNTIGRISNMRDQAVERFTNLRDRFFDLGNRLRDGVTERMQRMKDNTIGRVLSMRDEAVRRFSGMKDRFRDLASDIRDNLKDRFDDMVTAARELPGRIGDGIKNMASKATSGIKSFSNTVGSTLETGVNKVVGGMNNLLGKIGVSLRIPEINVPQYALGTKNHPGGPAIVGEKGRELAHLPGMGYTILGEKGAELLNLPKGSSVLPNKETEKLLKDGMGLPGYESGVGRAFDWVKGKAQQGWQNIKGLASDAVGWLLEAPRKLFEKAMEFVGVSMPRAEDFAGGIMRGSFSGLRDAVVEKLKGTQDEVAPSGSPSFGAQFRMTSPFGWRTHPVTGQRRHHNGIDYAAPTGTPLHSQSAGNVSFSGWSGGFGNVVIVKSGIFDHYYAHNSRNLVSAGQVVTKGQRIALVGSTGMSTGPHVHYEIRKNGTPVNPKGFKTGGLIKDKMFALLADGGYPEYVIPTDPSRATEAMKLLALAGKDIESRGGAKRPGQLPNPGGSDRMDKLEETIERMGEAMAMMMELLKQKKGDTHVHYTSPEPITHRGATRLWKKANQRMGEGL